MPARRFRFNPFRTKPRTAAERLSRLTCGKVLERLRKEIRDERKAKKHA